MEGYGLSYGKLFDFILNFPRSLKNDGIWNIFPRYEKVNKLDFSFPATFLPSKCFDTKFRKVKAIAIQQKRTKSKFLANF